MTTWKFGDDEPYTAADIAPDGFDGGDDGVSWWWVDDWIDFDVYDVEMQVEDYEDAYT